MPRMARCADKIDNQKLLKIEEMVCEDVRAMEHFRKKINCQAKLIQSTVKLQIFVWYPFSYFRLETGSYVLIFVLSRVCGENDVEFNGFKAKRNFHTILNFVLFQKYEMYENKYRTKICDFTVCFWFLLGNWFFSDVPLLKLPHAQSPFLFLINMDSLFDGKNGVIQNIQELSSLLAKNRHCWQHSCNAITQSETEVCITSENATLIMVNGACANTSWFTRNCHPVQSFCG